MGGGGSSAPTSTTVQQNSVPPFLEDAYLEGINRARSVSNEEYTPYAGQRIEGFNPFQEQAQQMTQQGIGQFQPTYNAGVQATQSATTPFSANTLDPYMNPYTDQVVNEIGRLGNQNFTDNLMPQINSQFTGGGMFGSSRNATALGREASKAQQGITGQQGQYLAQGFDKSMNAYQTDQARNLAAGAQLTSQAGQGQDMYGRDIAALSTAGGQQQQLNQMALDTAYNEFLTQQQYPQVQAQYFNNMVRGIPQGGLVTTEKQNYGGGGNQIGQALGLGASVYGAVNGAPKLAKGGHVKMKKSKAKAVGLGGTYV